MSDETEFQTKVIRTDTIRCPICQTVQQADVLEADDYPFLLFAHQCTNCHYAINEKSWSVVGERMEEA